MPQKTVHILLNNLSKAKELQNYLTKTYNNNLVKFQAIESFKNSPEPVEACLLDPPQFVDIPDSLKWAHSTWAGVDGFLNKLEKPLQFNLTRSAIYGRMMSEYTICNILNAERNHYYSYKNQLNKTWAKDGMTHNYSSLRGKKMAVLGSGEIGNEISRMFKQGFEIRTVAALVKNERQASENGNVENYYTNLNKLLEEHGQELDYLVSVLPSTKHTKNLLSESVFSQLKNCLFVNIGRGDICTEESIIEALDKKYLRHAVLDVVPIEPLPVDSKLWTHPNVIVTPHVSGKDNNEDICRLFLDNLDLYLRGDKLKYLVNVEQEY